MGEVGGGKGARPPKRVVAEGYDAVAERYLTWSAGISDASRQRYTLALLDGLPAGARVLELGCGAGGPTTRTLAARFAVTGVDISARQVELAQQAVPSATFIQSDMTALDFPSESFDGVAAFFSLIHVPREEQPPLLARIAMWLRPGGLFVATMGVNDTAGDVEENWLGAPMYFSHYDAEMNRRLVEEAGLRLLSANEETQEEDGRPITFLWVVARKPE
ncbi:MAG TPA: class I SAM-dependent methyltransferase [Ktedonobacterales bacterium]|nr:class I SAM-dependent methyltransferase [Ktedonobacterales bacterium]